MMYPATPELVATLNERDRAYAAQRRSMRAVQLNDRGPSRPARSWFGQRRLVRRSSPHPG